MTDPRLDSTLDEAVRDHYRAQGLDADTLATLRRQIAEEVPSDAAPRRAPDRQAAPGARTALRRMARWGAFAALALALGTTLWLAWPATGALSAEAIAQEIALNHVVALDPDVRAGSFAALTGDLDKLDFSVMEPDDIAMEEVIGARYCSLGGQMAAQIRFRDANARVCTLYQARDSEAFDAVREGTFEMSGVRVRVWREGGLVMGLAEPMHEG
ncbi:MAG: hypothetical protein AAF791_08415 [Bacteroidota bacterium]